MDPFSVIGLAASIVQLLELPVRAVELVGHGQINLQQRERILELASRIEHHLRTLEADGRYPNVFQHASTKLVQAKRILESTERCPSCSRCPTIITCIWDCVTSSRVRRMLDEAQHLLETLLNEEIVTAVNDVDRRVPRVADNPPLLPSIDIGLHRVQEILEFLEKEDGIRVVGIYGQGGLGKTTLLNKTLVELSKKGAFSTSAYVEVQQNPDNEHVKTLQSSIIQQLGGSKTEMQSIEYGKGALKKHFLNLKASNKTLFLAIDNLWEESALEQLLPDELASILPSSSFIMITTRSPSVVDKLDQLCSCSCSSPSHSARSGDRLYKVKRYRPEELSSEDSKDLFMKHASKIVPLTDEHMPLVDAIVPLCGGLPLALKVLGSLFSSKSSRQSLNWKDVVRRIRSDEENLPRGIESVFTVLRLSYDRLKPNTQKAFLDVASFFCGWEWNTVKHIVGDDEMEELENSSLLTRSFTEEVEWEVMQKGHPCSKGRMKGESEVTVRMHDLILRLGKNLAEQEPLAYVIKKGLLDSVVHDEEELKKVRGLWLSNLPEMIDANKVARMRNLRILHLDGSSTEDYKFVMRQLKKLQYLKLRPRFSEQRVTLEIFSKRRERDSLRFLSLESITSSLSAAQLPLQLRELHLHYCGSVVDLPSSSSELRMLERLHIHGCENFTRLPEVCDNWERLQELVIIGPNQLTELPVSIGNLGSLKLLSLAHCGNLVELPESIGNLGSLKLFRLANCCSLVTWPLTFWNLKSLESLKVEVCSSLANMLAVPSSVAHLEICDCQNLVSVCSRDSRFPVLENASLSRCPGGLVESILQMRDLSQLGSLGVYGCHSLNVLPPAIGQFCALKKLELSFCKRLTELPDELGNLLSLENLDVANCRALRRLPSQIGKLQSLKMLRLWGCYELLELPEGIGNLMSLKNLDASFCGKLQKLPPTIRNAMSLEVVNLRGCDELLELPEGLGDLRLLRTLNLRHCRRLRRVPNVGSKVRLDVEGCDSLEWMELPMHMDFRRLGWCPPMDVLSFENLEYLEVKMSDHMTESQWIKAGGIASLQRLLLVDDDGTSSTLPLQAFMLSQLRILEIQGFQSFREWPDDAPWSLPLLERLKLEGLENLIALPLQVCSLGNLQSLQLLRCLELEDLPPDFNRLGLQRLTLECSWKLCSSNSPQPWPISLNVLFVHLDLQEFPPQIGQLHALEKLALIVSSLHYRIRYLDLDSFNCELICKAPSKRLRVFASLPGHMGDLLALKELHLIGLEGLHNLPAEIGKLTKLERLVLRECRSLRDLPGEGIGQLLNLRRLQLENCDALESLPSQISMLTKLEYLWLRWCWSVQELPSQVGNLLKLEDLDLSGCMSLQSLPSSLTNLIQLWIVDAKWCPGLRHSHNIQFPPGSYVDKDQKLLTWKTRVFAIVACSRLKSLLTQNNSCE